MGSLSGIRLNDVVASAAAADVTAALKFQFTHNGMNCWHKIMNIINLISY